MPAGYPTAAPRSDIPGDNRTPETPPTYFSPKSFGSPFDAENADIVLRSSQWVDFRAHKLLLSLASPVFKSMLSMPQPNSPADSHDYAGGLPVVRMSEDTMTLQHLLTAVYPLPVSLPGSYEDTILVLAAAQKFEMKGALSSIRTAMRASGIYDLAREKPLQIYGLAYSHGLEDEAISAAWHTLPRASLERYGKELCFASGSALYELTQYWHRCVTGVSELIRDSPETSMKEVRKAHPQRPACGHRLVLDCAPGVTHTPQWWVEYWRAVEADVRSGLKPCTDPVDVSDLYKTMSMHAETDCNNCKIENVMSSLKLFHGYGTR
ncbi:hypothetical protein EVG20_g6301 [Dentipellis fragilis]|uniref:BTB domain-containing protein n=1 Tax=Dentipellis fragilis TaxID=205917 RepID=A0A4Y9YNT8_9AGAM|nr:hypothetical protein EVG20_g6301 [Dentipellis fragilis]